MRDYVITKKDFAATGRNILSFFAKNKETLFLITGLLSACAASVFLWCGSLIFWLSIAAAAIVFFCLKFANIEIESPVVRGGWACIMHAVFLTVTSVLSVGEPGEPAFHIGDLPAVFVCVILYTYIPLISYALGLNDEKESYDLHTCRKTRYNGYIGMLFLYMAVSVIITISEHNAKDDFDFSREEFVKVTDWKIENRAGDTYYIISCPKGRFAVSPYSYPEVRDINKNTQVKILARRSSVTPGLLDVTKLEIKNK